MVVSVHVGTITIPILLVRRLSLGPEAQPVSNNSQTPTGVHMAPNWGSSHIPYTVIHLPQKLPSHTHSHAHPPLRPVTHPSDSPVTHTCTHTYIHIYNTHLLTQTLRPMVSHSPQTHHPHTHIDPVAGRSHLSQLRDLLCSPQTHDSDTGPPPRKNRSRTNSFWE